MPNLESSRALETLGFEGESQLVSYPSIYAGSANCKKKDVQAIPLV